MAMAAARKDIGSEGCGLERGMDSPRMNDGGSHIVAAIAPLLAKRPASAQQHDYCPVAGREGDFSGRDGATIRS
jgi:hypothetical protein